MTKKLPNMSTEAGQIWTTAISLISDNPEASLKVECPNDTSARRLACNMHRLRSKLREAIGNSGTLSTAFQIPLMNKLIVRRPTPNILQIELDELKHTKLILSNSLTGEILNGNSDSALHDNQPISPDIEEASI